MINLNTWIVTIFPDYGDLRDWWYSFNEHKYLNYLIATNILTLFASFVWKIVTCKTSSLKTFSISLIISMILLIVGNGLYWGYLKNTCFGHGLIPIDECYINVFGSLKSAQVYYSLILYITFFVESIIYGWSFFNRQVINKVAWVQIVGSISPHHLIQTVVFSLYHIMIGAYYWRVSEIPIINIMTIPFCILIIFDVIKKIICYKELEKYYKQILDNRYFDGSLIVVKEPENSTESFLYRVFLSKSHIKNMMMENKIYIIPSMLYDKNMEISVKIDVYKSDKINNEVNKFQNAALEERGIFNFCYCESLNVAKDNERLYDSSFLNEDNLVKNIESIPRYLSYKKSQQTIINQMKVEELQKTTFFTEEILILKQFFCKNVDSFLVFDYAIKCMETLNYFFSLMIISQEKISVSEEVLLDIRMADFDRWRKIREKYMKSATMNQIMTSETIDKKVFICFEKVWKCIVNRNYLFKEFSLTELLKALNSLRDYTRGHGVFSFEISYEINLNLLEILVFLVNQMLECRLLDFEYRDLVELGWIVFWGDVPYFLYSYDDKNKELCFNSFKKGNSITLPIDYREIDK